MRFVLRWADEDGFETVTESGVDIQQPSAQLTILKVNGLWADETVWTVVHNTEGVRILRADWGISKGDCRGDGIDTLQPDIRLQEAMEDDLVRHGRNADPEMVAQWVAMLEDIECREVTRVLPKTRVWVDLLRPVSKASEGYL